MVVTYATSLMYYIKRVIKAILHYFFCNGESEPVRIIGYAKKSAEDIVAGKCPYAYHANAELIASLLAMLIIAIIAIILGNAIKKADPHKPTKGLAFFAEAFVSYGEKQIRDILGNVYLKFTPYYLFLISYIIVGFAISLFGFAAPFTFYTIPLCLAFVTWLGINISAIHFQKVEYLKGFTSPLPTWLPVFVPINMLSKMAPLMSLSIRLFGNALAGSILMALVYWGTGNLSELIFHVAGLNVFGMIIAPILHAYFDAFGAFIQMTIFTTLTMLLISVEIPAPVNVDENILNQKKASKRNKKSQKEA